MKRNVSSALLVALFFVAVVYSILPSQSKIAGSHSVYRIRNSSATGDLFFCAKCHVDIAGNITSSNIYKAHDSISACICHGYYPNYTNLGGENISINLKHNLTKNVYCTNCHTRYNTTGQIDIGNNQNALNQSGHYIYINQSNTTEVYERAYRYFNQSPFGPLE